MFATAFGIVVIGCSPVEGYRSRFREHLNNLVQPINILNSRPQDTQRGKIEHTDHYISVPKNSNQGTRIYNTIKLKDSNCSLPRKARRELEEIHKEGRCVNNALRSTTEETLRFKERQFMTVDPRRKDGRLNFNQSLVLVDRFSIFKLFSGLLKI